MNDQQPKSAGVTRIGSSERANGLEDVKFYTVAEVAAVLRVSKMSVYRLIHAGDLEAVRFGRSFRVAAGAVDTYLRDSFYETG